jgi:hypothetical protein
VDGGTQIRLYDPQRNPSEWTEILQPNEYAVLAKRRRTSVPVSASDGKPYPKLTDATCVVFESLDAAQRFCEAKVQALRDVRFEIYDSQGLAQRPLLVIGATASSSQPSQGRRLAAGILLLVSAPLFWMGTRESSASVLATFIAINCIIVALRLLHWEFGVKDAEKERRERLEAHRARSANKPPTT